MRNPIGLVLLVGLVASCSVFKKSSSSSSSSSSADATAPDSPPPAAQSLQLNYDRLAANECNPLQVRFIDTAGDYFFVANNETVSFSTTSTDKFYSDNQCTAVATSVTINKDDCCSNDNVSGNIFYHTADVGLGTLTVTDSGTVGLAAITVNYNVWLIAGMNFSGTASQSSTSCGPFTVQTVLGDFKTVSPVTAASTVALKTDSSTGVFYSDSGCTQGITSVALANGAGTSPMFYYKDSTVGTQNLSADISVPAPSDQFASDDILGYLSIQITQ